MKVSDVLTATFREVMTSFAESPAIRLLSAGGVGVSQFKAVLREIYHYAKEDPQIQALVTVYFRGDDRKSVKIFLKHAISEVGHDQLALSDLKTLGEDVSTIPATLPLPTTIALTAFPFYQIQYSNPIGYLGYLYFLEHMPTKAGASYMSALEAAGIRKEAMSFLHEHMTVDIAHNKLLDEYITRLVRTESDLAAVVYAMTVTGYLYGQMLAGAVASAESSRSMPPNLMELARSSRNDTSVSFAAA